MIGPPSNMQIWIAAGVTDLRRGFTGLSALVQTKLEQSPLSGQVFVFRGRRGDLIKVEVSSGGARLQLDGRAQADGRTGETIPVRNVATGKVFSARVSEKGRVVLTASRPPAAKDLNQ